MKLKLLSAGVALALLAFSDAFAQLDVDSEQPIDITGDQAETVDDVVTWTGNVRAIQGESVLSSERLVATLGDEQQLRTIEASGAVRYSNGKEAIASSAALYDAVSRSITFTGDVIVTQGETVITGGALVYWLDSKKVKLTAPQGGRIRGIFHTKSGDPRL